MGESFKSIKILYWAVSSLVMGWEQQHGALEDVIMAHDVGWALGRGNGERIRCESIPFGLHMMGSMLLKVLGSIFPQGGEP